VLDKLNKLDSTYTNEVCAQVTKEDIIADTVDAFHAGMIYEYFGCKSLKSKIDQFTEQVKNGSKYDHEEDYFYA